MSIFFTTKRKIYSGLAIFLLILNIFIWQEVFAIASPHYLNVNILDVGQGDSIFIETPDMRHILIDGGPNSIVLEKLQKLLPFWDKSLDIVILTHPDADHIIGLLYVLQRYKVDYILWTGIIREGGSYEQWTKLLEKSKNTGTKIIKAKLGLKIKSGKVEIDTLHPFEDLTGKFFEKQGNDTGIVLRLDYGKKSFLFTADISSKVEHLMISNKINLDSDVLKVPHHGSKYSTSEEFIQAISPEIAVISVGDKNMYGHPTPEVLQRLEKFGIKIFRTDQDGDVIIESDGEKIKVK